MLFEPVADNVDDKNGKAYNDMLAYGQSKTANMLYAISLAQKLKGKGIEAYSVHPGRIPTNLSRYIPTEQLVKLGM
jgi:NAD(P)-dependent dehydrogenase (short-subunit alcohol dehydrogenase family)